MFGNPLINLPKLMRCNNCFSRIITDVFPPWQCVNTHLNAADLQTAKASAFIGVLALADDPLIKRV